MLRGQEGSYALLEVIGRGAYGTVYKGIWREVGRHVAIKRVARSRLSADEEKQLQTEILLFKNLKHTHIVNYIEAVDDPESSFLDIVMEFVEGGSLFSIVQSIRKSLDPGQRVFDEQVVADFIRQVVFGLRYLHHQGVVHRDIKGANILVTKESNVKLADFGVASTKPADSGPIDVAGSPYWMAPEIISLTGSSTASDIWSVGCTVIELLTGFPPYHEFSDVTALFRIVSDECPPLPRNLSTECEHFLRKCFDKDMHTRASADELLQHRWLARPGVEDLSEAGPGIEASSSAAPGSGSPIAKTSHDVEGGLANSSHILEKYDEADEEGFDDLVFEDDVDGGMDDTHIDEHAAENGSHAFDFDERGDFDMDASGTAVSSVGGSMGDLSTGLSRVNIQDDPFKDVMEDPEADLERERIRKQKEMWELVKIRAKALGQSETEHVSACEGLIAMFKENPEQRYYLIYDPGLLPIIEVLEGGGNGNPRVVKSMLRVTLSLVDSEGANSGIAAQSADKQDLPSVSASEIASFGYPRVSNIREDMCLAGFLPVVMRYCKRTEPFEVRLLAARFLEKMLEFERALHMFIACRGFSVFVEELEPDIIKAGELSRIALGGIDRMLSMENQRHKRDFCRRFASSGLLERIVEGICYNMDYLQDASNRRAARDGDAENEVRSHVTKLAKLLQTFAARADPMVKAKMITQSVLHPMIRQITNRLTPQAGVTSILCCVRDLSRDPQTHFALQDASAIEKLVNYLSADMAMAGTNPQHYIISSLHNLCIVSQARQEAAAKAGLVPHLQRFIISKDIIVRSLCIDIYSGLACAGHPTRVELSKHRGVEFYVDLLVMLSVPGTVRKWQARVLQSVFEWLDDPTQSEMVENRLVLEKNRSRVCCSLARMRILDVEGVLEPYLRMITVSERVNRVYGASQELVLALVRWLEGMYNESNRATPRMKLLLLRTLLVHARMWTKESGNWGIIEAMKLLLTDVILVGDEAITVQDQASLLLSALGRIRD